VDRREKTVRLGAFYLLPEHQNQGIGSQVLDRILYSCDKDQRDCVVSLLIGNQACSLFKRHGFREIDSDGAHTRLLRNWRYP
jgi:GNAT superfamily N-acetyltransferase